VRVNANKMATGLTQCWAANTRT